MRKNFILYILFLTDTNFTFTCSQLPMPPTRKNHLNGTLPPPSHMSSELVNPASLSSPLISPSLPQAHFVNSSIVSSSPAATTHINVQSSFCHPLNNQSIKLNPGLFQDIHNGTSHYDIHPPPLTSTLTQHSLHGHTHGQYSNGIGQQDSVSHRHRKVMTPPVLSHTPILTAE